MLGRRATAVGIAAILGLFGCNAPPRNGEPIASTEEALTKVCPAVTVEGLDIAGGQGTVDWSAVKASGREFAIIKATQGDYYTSNHWTDQWTGAKAAGLLRSPYHFFDPTIDGVAQAKHFLDVVGPLGPGDLPPMLDIECPTSSDQAQTQADCEYGGATPDSGWVSATVLNQRIHDWLSYVEAQTGRTPLIYSYNSWFDDSGTDSTMLAEYPLVISWPSATQCYEVGIGNDFTSAAFWQWSVTGTCPGVTGEVDLDRFNGSLAELDALAELGGQSQISGNDAMTLVNWTNDGHPEIFVKTTQGEMVHFYPQATTDTWGMLYDLDKGSTCGAAAGFWPNGAYAELFDPASDGSVQHLWLDFTNGWNDWQHDIAPAKVALSRLSTLAWPDGHMEVFALGADHAIWHSSRAPADATWSAWTSLGGTFVTGSTAINWLDGHAEIFATDAAGAVWHNASGAYPSGWKGWSSLGGDIASRPVPVRWADGHLEVFARGIDNQLYHSAYTNSVWGAFSVLSAGTKIAGEPSAIMNPAGGVATAGPEVFARDESGKVVHLAWDGTNYPAFIALFDQAAASDPFGWIRSDGTAEVFAIDPTGVLTRSYHGAVDWTAWSAIGGTDLDPCLSLDSENPDAGPDAMTGAGGSAITSASIGASGTGGALGTSDGSSESSAGCSCRVIEGEGTSGASAAFFFAFAFAGASFERRRRRIHR